MQFKTEKVLVAKNVCKTPASGFFSFPVSYLDNLKYSVVLIHRFKWKELIKE